MCANFNYAAIIGNPGTGKTTFAKTLLNGLVWDRLFLVDPNRQYSDYTMNQNATYISPQELRGAMNIIGKKLLLQQKKGCLVIEDLKFTIDRLCETLQIKEKKAKNIITLLIENLRKYDVKIIVVMHDVDLDIVQKCDFKVFCQLPLTSYKIREYSKLLGIDMNRVNGLAKYDYLSKNGGDIETGHIEPLESHMAIEKDKSFMVKELLAQCHSLAEKVLILRLHVELKNSEIAKTLNVDLHTVENLIWRLRKRNIPIPDARHSFRLETLAF